MSINQSTKVFAENDLSTVNGINEPWYKQFWPWFLVFFPALAVVAGIATIIIAVKSDDGLVEENYYKAGLAINQTIADEERAKVLGLSAQMDINTESRQINLKLNSTGTHEIVKQRLMLKLIHPTIKGRDVTIPLQAQSTGIFHGFLDTLPVKGRWYVTLTPEDKSWRISDEMLIPIPSGWSLTPGE